MRKPYWLIVLLIAWVVLGCGLSLQAQSPDSRAALALALAKGEAVKTDCPACGKPGCACGCGGDPAYCTCNGPVTQKATDGGPDWTYDARTQTWWRRVPAEPMSTPTVTTPVFYQPAPQFFAPPPMMRPMFFGGGGGGGGC